MVEAGIEDSDLVLIKQQSFADPGNIVVALIDNAKATATNGYRTRNLPSYAPKEELSTCY